MPKGYSISPRLLKEALIELSERFLGPVPNIIVFQYNAEQLSRSLADRSPPRKASNAGGAKEDLQRVLGPPVEVIYVTVEPGDPDQAEQKNQLRKGLTS